jgi:hypothetical protein
MDPLTLLRAVPSPSAHGRLSAPFYSRAYGGYTRDQLAFALSHTGSLRHRVVLDPMAGQGFYLSRLAWDAATIYLGDLNPATLLLASLRDPTILTQAQELAGWLSGRLAKLQISPPAEALTYSEDWLSLPIRRQLDQYRALFRLDSLGDPTSPYEPLWHCDGRSRLAAALPILAARQLAAFTPTDNITWLRNGGLQRIHDIRPVLHAALATWTLYAKTQASLASSHRLQPAALAVRPMNPVLDQFADTPSPYTIITSPPYANRLDYTRLWGPELAVMAAIFPHLQPAILKSEQLGSNIVRHKSLDPEDVASLPKNIIAVLHAIRDETDRPRASASYYYPFFAHYAIDLARAVRNLAHRLLPGGTCVFFVRDTVAKDVLFPTGDLVQQTVLDTGTFVKIGDQRQIIRRHIGLRQRKRRVGIYGIAQQEWWLAFQRGVQ